MPIPARDAIESGGLPSQTIFRGPAEPMQVFQFVAVTLAALALGLRPLLKMRLLDCGLE